MLNQLTNKFKAATKTIEQSIKAINYNIDAFEYKHFGDLDKKYDELYDAVGNIIAIKAKGTKNWINKEK